MPTAPPPASDAQRLKRLYQLLEQALTAQDWTRIARIDLAIQRQLQILAPATAADPEVTQAKQRLKELHARALLACREECDRLKARLTDHQQNAEARMAYQQAELFQGES